MELISGETELDNEKIAFLRAYNALEKFGPLPGLGKAEQAIATKTNHEVSGSFRRVIVRVTLENALDDRYSELSPPSRWIVNWRQSKQRVVSLEKVNK